MKRLHLFELEDQKWFPSLFRFYITDILQYKLTQFKIYDSIIPEIKQALMITKDNQIIDLCSGSGGPWLQIYPPLKSDISSLTVILTDKYPNFTAFKRNSELSTYNLNFYSESVDVTNVPRELKGFRTLFSSFHHFTPDVAKQILQDAVDKGTGIGIFEFTDRNWVNMIVKMLFLGPLLILLLTPFIRPFKFSRIFFTYILPLIPIFFVWDGLVSHWRTYTPEELEQMIQELKGQELYKWKIGQIKKKKLFINITYLVSYPAN